MGQTLRVGSLVSLLIVPLYAMLMLFSRVAGTSEWPGPSPYFWTAWFAVALWITIRRALTQELRKDDPMSKAMFALGTVNVAIAFLATLLSPMS